MPRPRWQWTLAVWLLLGLVSAQGAPPRLYVNYHAKPDAGEIAKYDFCILDPEADVDLGPSHEAGHTCLAYVSTVELRPDSPFAAKTKERGIPVLGRNEGWANDVLDVTHPAWVDFIIEDVAAPALAKGYDGVFLDTLDSVAIITAKDPTKKAACHKALVNLVHRLHARFKRRKIVLNRGFELVNEVAKEIHGVLAEGLFQEWDASKKTYYALKPDDTKWLLTRLKAVQDKGLPVFVIDYVSPKQLLLAKKTAARITALGFVPFITTPTLQGEALAP